MPLLGTAAENGALLKLEGEGGGVGGQTRVDLATLAFFPCFIGFFGPVKGVNLIKAL